MANSPRRELISHFWIFPLRYVCSELLIDKPLLLWINDGLMAVFFLMIGLEVKRELCEGALANREQALFPAIAALGGMVVPALIYLLFNGSDEITREGWAIPAATDIAFALGVMALLGSRVPAGLKVFLWRWPSLMTSVRSSSSHCFTASDVSVLALGLSAVCIGVLAL